MTFRPQPARWFELVTTKPHLAAALGALALTGAVELESQAELHREALLPDLDELLKAYSSVARSYEGLWPAPRAIPPSGDPRALLEDDWRRVSEWRKDADPAISRIESLAQERVDLDALLDALARAGDEFPDPSRLAGAGPRVAATLVRLPPQALLGEAARGALTIRWEAPEAAYVLAVGPPDEVREFASQAPNLKGRVIPLPNLDRNIRVGDSLAGPGFMAPCPIAALAAICTRPPRLCRCKTLAKDWGTYTIV